jgi:hypothetical protein
MILWMLLFVESTRTSMAFTATNVRPMGTTRLGRSCLAFSQSSPPLDALNSFGSTVSTALVLPEELTKVIGSGGNESLLIGGGAVALLGLFAAVVSAASAKNSKGTTTTTTKEAPEPEPIDVSIPYDAAIVLAYQKAFGKEPDFSGECYQKFKKLYLEQSVLEVTLKQKTKAMDSFVSTTEA